MNEAKRVNAMIEMLKININEINDYLDDLNVIIRNAKMKINYYRNMDQIQELHENQKILDETRIEYRNEINNLHTRKIILSALQADNETDVINYLFKL